VQLKGDVELDFDDEILSKEELKEDRSSFTKNYEVEPTTSKTVHSKGPSGGSNVH
jgi:hypothetical protein